MMTISRRMFSTSLSRPTMVEMFYDLASPYTCLQVHLLDRQLGHWKSMDLKMTPVSIAHIMKASSNSPPIKVQAKGRYMFRDLKDLSEYYRIPFALPDIFVDTVFEKGTVKTQRFMMAVHENAPELHDKLIRIAYANFFTTENAVDIANIEEMKKLASKAGCSTDLIAKIEQDMNDDKVKTALKQNTDRVVELGCFGLPMTLVHRSDEPLEMSWVFGSDRIHIIGHYLGEKEPPILR
ncbi:hypothetical protein HUG17_10352 [Dermatophagoides farinae]|uniref:Glutathione S-transferase kappa n=2 Tax=Dermatophagoides farinae TaxID=6954 RepID=A0A9D4SB86_DERFA|nr:hypothetical protein HUG17_10352 [Dermatophagoides farinae]